MTFEVGDLEIQSVADDSGALAWNVREGRLDVGLPAGTAQIRVDFKYRVHRRDGGVISGGSTRTWPDQCGNLFPCNSDPSDGAEYRLALSGLTANQVGVFAPSIASEAPAYMVAWAVGDYRYTKLGTTDAGTEVGWYATEASANKMSVGTRNLLASFNWLEKTLGPYPFGDKVASVEVDWGSRKSGAFEAHPYWHVTTESLDQRWFHVHEAAHGWFGNGVRIACWEDYVLSEGVVSYLTARALEETSRYEADQLWRDYAKMVRAASAWPRGCNEHEVDDFGTQSLSLSLYARGAFFFRALEEEVGRENLDLALSTFYLEHRGKAARFHELLDHVKAKTEFDSAACAEAWLRSATPPEGTKGCPR